MSDLDELVLRVKADTADANAKLDQLLTTAARKSKEAESALKGLKDQFKELIPAITLATMVEFGRRSVEAAGHIQDLADRVGFAASSLAALEIPLAQSGSSLDEFVGSINRMNNAVGEAA